MNLKKGLFYTFVLGCIISTIYLLFMVISLLLMNAFVHDILLYYLVLGFGSVLPTLVFVGSEHISQKKMWLCFVLHFMLTISAVLGIQYFFAWLYPERAAFYSSFGHVMLYFSAIYMIAMFVFLRGQKGLAKQFNERIQAHKLERLRVVNNELKGFQKDESSPPDRAYDLDLWDMSLKNRLLIMLVLGCIITTMRMFSVNIVYLFKNSPIYRDLFCLILGFGSALPILIFIGIANISQRGLRIRFAGHFTLSTVIVFGTHFLFARLYPYSDFFFYLPISSTLMLYLVIYSSVVFFSHHNQVKLANQFNKGIQQRRHEQLMKLKELEEK